MLAKLIENSSEFGLHFLFEIFVLPVKEKDELFVSLFHLFSEGLEKFAVFDFFRRAAIICYVNHYEVTRIEDFFQVFSERFSC